VPTNQPHSNLIARIQAKEGVRLHMLAETVDGHDLDCLQVCVALAAACHQHSRVRRAC
jgi:hypothetical protein